MSKYGKVMKQIIYFFLVFLSVSISEHTHAMPNQRTKRNQYNQQQKQSQQPVQKQLVQTVTIPGVQLVSTAVAAQALKRCKFTSAIRVLLNEQLLDQPCQWTFSAPGGFIIIDSKTPKKKFLHTKDTLTLTNTGKKLLLNGTLYTAEELALIPLKDKISYNTLVYDGALMLCRYNNKLYLVNYIDLEDYVLGVLPSESWPGWPEHVNKALCISIRSYGIAKVLEHRARHAQKNKKVPYDIKNTNIHQVYKGCTRGTALKSIVDETRGIVLSHNNKPIVAMFDACCGGVIPAHKKGIDFVKAPYFARGYPCNYCKEYKFYQWTHTYTHAELKQALGAIHKNIRLSDVRVVPEDKAGCVGRIEIKNGRAWCALPVQKIKSSLKNLKSLCFTIKRSGTQYIFTGKGHGHHWGLCQWGAAKLAKLGRTYKQILQFYYPGARLMKLRHDHARV
jgi:stage II sporulation protein D